MSNFIDHLDCVSLPHSLKGDHGKYSKCNKELDFVKSLIIKKFSEIGDDVEGIENPIYRNTLKLKMDKMLYDAASGYLGKSKSDFRYGQEIIDLIISRTESNTIYYVANAKVASFIPVLTKNDLINFWNETCSNLWVKLIYTFVVYSLLYFFGGLNKFFNCVIALSLIDYFVGVLKDIKTGNLSALRSIRRQAQKFLLFVWIAVGHILDSVCDSGLGIFGFRNLAFVFITAQCLISISEQLDYMGVPTPRFMKKVVQFLRDDTNTSGRV